jgi:hypothetical protein
VNGTKEEVGKFGGSIGHGQGSAACAILSLDNFISSELNSVNESLPGLRASGDVLADGRLREKGNNGYTTVTTDNRDNRSLGSSRRNERGGELRSSDDVKCSDTEESARVVGTRGFEDLGNNWDCST